MASSTASKTYGGSSRIIGTDMMTDSHIVDTIPLHDTAPSTGKPMTLPALLRQNVPGYRTTSMAQKSRVAQLKEGKSSTPGTASSGKMGKRKQRRWENANFHGSSVVKPRQSDYSPCQLSSSPNFPSPPPSTFYPYHPTSSSSSNPSDPTHVPENVFDDSKAADYGRFSLPIKGLKRSTRRIVCDGGVGEEIVDVVDSELREWLEGAHVFLQSTFNGAGTMETVILNLEQQDKASSDSPTIAQISKLPHSLIWAIEDPFVRFLVHAIARYYRVVSFTKTDPTTSRHLVYLLRPNMPARTVDPLSKLGLETPPSTEWEINSVTSGNNSTTEESSAVSSSEYEESEDAESETASLLDEGEGDETVQAIPIHELRLEERSTTIPSMPPRGRMRSTLPTPALSDIDSGAEVELSEEDDSDSVHSLSQSIDSLSYPSPSSNLPVATQDPSRPLRLINPAIHPSSSSAIRDDSISRDTSPTRPLHRVPLQSRRPNQLPGNGNGNAAGGGLIPSLKKLNNAKSKEVKGWRMPETGFKEWVMVK